MNELVVFGAPWCGPCKKQTTALQEAKIPFRYVDVEQEPAYAHRFHVRSVPTLIWMADDKPQWQANGLQTVEHIRKTIEDLT